MCVGEGAPYLLQNPYPSMYVLSSGKGRRWVEIKLKTLPWSVWFKTFFSLWTKKKIDCSLIHLMENMELTLKLKDIYEVECPVFGVG
jgi:hypothetical protein